MQILILVCKTFIYVQFAYIQYSTYYIYVICYDRNLNFKFQFTSIFSSPRSNKGDTCINQFSQLYRYTYSFIEIYLFYLNVIPFFFEYFNATPLILKYYHNIVVQKLIFHFYLRCINYKSQLCDVDVACYKLSLFVCSILWCKNYII